jgi:predicted MFS family arabinose efflux permease
MSISLIATVLLLPTSALPPRRQRIGEPLQALRHRSLAITSVVGLLYNWGFFTLLGYSPFLMGKLDPQQLGLVFCGWGILVGTFAVWVAPWLRARVGTARTLYANLALMAAVLAVVAIWSDRPAVVIAATIVSGAFVGVNNTLVTVAVMSIAPVERPIASATYGFVRFIGGGLAPYAAGQLAERDGARLPFLIAAGVVLVAVAVLTLVHRALGAADRGEVAQPELDALDTAERADELPIAAGLGSTD